MGGFKCEDKFTVSGDFGRYLTKAWPSVSKWVNSYCDGTDCNFASMKKFDFTQDDFCAFERQLKNIEAGRNQMNQASDEAEATKANIAEKARKQSAAVDQALVESNQPILNSMGAVARALDARAGAIRQRAEKLHEERELWAHYATLQWSAKFGQLATYLYPLQANPNQQLKPNLDIFIYTSNTIQLGMTIFGQPVGEKNILDAGIYLSFDNPEEVTHWLDDHLSNMSALMGDCNQRRQVENRPIPRDEVCLQKYNDHSLAATK